MGKQAKARRRREGWGFTSKRFRPVTAPEPTGSAGATGSASDEDDRDSNICSAKRKADAGAGAPTCPRTKRRKAREERDLKLYVGKKGLAAKRRDAAAANLVNAAAADTPVHTLPPVDWAAESLAPFKRDLWPASDGWPTEAPTPAGWKQARQAIGVVVRGRAVPPPIASFTDPSLPKAMRKFLKRATKFDRPTPVQAQGWPAILSGADVVAVAPTGTGKTLT